MSLPVVHPQPVSDLLVRGATVHPPTHLYSCGSRKGVALGASVQLPVGRLWAVGAIQATGQQVLPKGRIR